MPKSKKASVQPEKARLRRPKGSGAYPITPLRLPPELVMSIDKHAERAGTTRSGLIRQFIEAGLKRRQKG